jgi:hypothetical protein
MLSRSCIIDKHLNIAVSLLLYPCFLVCRNYTASNTEFERLFKEAVTAYFEVLSRYMIWGTAENRKVTIFGLWADECLISTRCLQTAIFQRHQWTNNVCQYMQSYFRSSQFPSHPFIWTLHPSTTAFKAPVTQTHYHSSECINLKQSNYGQY